MMKGKTKQKTDLTAESLMGMQPVRTSFTLPVKSIRLLGVAASQLGLKQKSLFEHLIEERTILQQVAEEARKYHPENIKRRKKTFVVSRKSLDALDSVAKQYQMPRHVLVELSIERLLSVIDSEKNGMKTGKSY